jgi:hypothetical protein
MWEKVHEVAAPMFGNSGGVEACIVDDTLLQKKSSHSVGKAR